MKQNRKRSPVSPGLLVAAAVLVLAVGLFCLVYGLASARGEEGQKEPTADVPGISPGSQQQTPENGSGVRPITEEEKQRMADEAAEEEQNSDGTDAPSGKEERVTYAVSVSGGERLQPGILDALTGFLDEFYASQKSFAPFFKTMDGIRVPDMTERFAEPDGLQAAIWQSALKYLCSAKTVNGYDLSWSECSYSLKIGEIKPVGTTFEISFTESSEVCFSHLQGVRSVQNGLPCRAVFQKVEDQWKLVSYYREEDFFLAVSRLVTEDTTAEELPEITVWLLTRYCGNYLKMMQHRESFNSGEVGYRTSDHPYDRQAAASYAAQYCLTRNSAYTNYDELGGNNQNFVSQVLRAGGIPNDTTGNWKWKYYGDDVDETERAAGRTPSWVGAYYFYNYAISNYDSGLASTVGANFFAAEGGDVLMTGPEKDLFNTSYVVLSTCEEDGAVFEILLGSNSVDRENWPMTACFAPYVTMIKVQGWKD
ncbi:MAG: amidase domain-containing protein [Oscillospiraceae bacterium]|nr:amidase domain-containing protein [Oscillospiraceae bacterium]